MPPDEPPPIGMIHRFGLIIEVLKRAIVGAAERNRALAGPITVLLWNSLARRLRLLAALQARFAAGTLVVPRPRSPSERPAAARARPARLPRGALLARYGAAYQQAALRELLDHPETLALLAATPRAGRLLRPLWRMLTADPMPEMLRLPPRPRRVRLPPPPPSAAPPRRLPSWATRPTPSRDYPSCRLGRDRPFRPPSSGWIRARLRAQGGHPHPGPLP